LLELKDEIRQCILLEVPWHPLCSPDCKGLCSFCGHDRNLGDCGCVSPRAPGPWDALRKLNMAESRAADTWQKKE
jgi:uncharacterized protein